MQTVGHPTAPVNSAVEEVELFVVQDAGDPDTVQIVHHAASDEAQAQQWIDAEQKEFPTIHKDGLEVRPTAATFTGNKFRVVHAQLKNGYAFTPSTALDVPTDAELYGSGDYDLATFDSYLGRHEALHEAAAYNREVLTKPKANQAYWAVVVEVSEPLRRPSLFSATLSGGSVGYAETMGVTYALRVVHPTALEVERIG